MNVLLKRMVRFFKIRRYSFFKYLQHLCIVLHVFWLKLWIIIHKIYYPKSGDFIVDDNYVFEIGGKNKTNRQIKEIKHSYIAMDEAETGFANKIPLWLFGFLY